MTRKLMIFSSLLMLLAGCQKELTDDAYQNNEDGKYEITVRLGRYAIDDFDDVTLAGTRTMVSADKLGTVANVAFYQNGERVKVVNQTHDDAKFGEVKVMLGEGDFQMLALVHRCEGNATTGTLDKVTFPSNKVTDTFSGYNSVTISQKQTIDFSLERVVAKFRLIVNDAIPDNVKQMKFYYTGGSSTLNGQTGFGSVNSRQTEILDVKSHEAGQEFEVYTFPRERQGKLKMTVSAIDATGSTVAEQVMDAVPVEVNKKTTTVVNFFGGSNSSSNSSFILKADDAWNGEIDYNP